MKESIVKSYDESPLFLNADMLAKVLGVATSTAYELMHEKDFPALKIGNLWETKELEVCGRTTLTRDEIRYILFEKVIIVRVTVCNRKICKTYQCYPSYKTIGKALKIKSKGTVAKYVRELEDKRLIYTEPTEVILKDAKKRNGNLKYTISPVQDALEHFYHEQMQENALAMQREKVAELLKESGINPMPAA